MSSSSITATLPRPKPRPEVRTTLWFWTLTRIVKGERITLYTASASPEGVAGAADCQRRFAELFPKLDWNDAAYTGEFRIGLRPVAVYTLTPVPNWPTPRPSWPKPRIKDTYTCSNCHSEVPKHVAVCLDCGRDVS